jgi:hypothetical protein
MESKERLAGRPARVLGRRMIALVPVDIPVLLVADEGQGASLPQATYSQMLLAECRAGRALKE